MHYEKIKNLRYKLYKTLKILIKNIEKSLIGDWKLNPLH